MEKEVVEQEKIKEPMMSDIIKWPEISELKTGLMFRNKEVLKTTLSLCAINN